MLSITMKEQTNADSHPCEEFTPHFFKPSYCIQCFMPKSKHVPQTTSNNNQDLKKNCLNSDKMHTKAGNNTGYHQKPKPKPKQQIPRIQNELKSEQPFLSNGHVSEEGDCQGRAGMRELLQRFEGKSNAETSCSQNGHSYPKQSKPVKRNSHKSAYVSVSIPSRRPSIKDKPRPSFESEHEHTGVLKPASAPPVKKSLQKSKPTKDSKTSQPSAKVDENFERYDTYEVIYPTDDTEVKAESGKKVQLSDGLLETPELDQRSYSDAASYNPPPTSTSRPKSTSNISSNKTVLEFQKIACRLKHSHRSFDDELEGNIAPQETETKDKSEIKTYNVNPPSSGNTEGEIKSSSNKKTASEILSLNNNAKSSETKITAVPNLPLKSCQDVNNANAGKEASIGKVNSDQKVWHHEEAESKQNHKISDSNPDVYYSKSSDPTPAPGFMMEALMPESVTIVSADGTIETVSPRTQPTLPTMPSPMSPKSPCKIVDIAFDSMKDSVQSTGTEENHQSTLSKFPRSKVTLPDGLFSKLNSSPDAIAASDLNLSEFQVSETKNNDNSHGKNTLVPDKRATPPFPIILEGQGSVISKKRDSGTYKVPIFITPQDYDNIGTVKADQDYEEAKRESLDRNQTDEEQYYLKPKLDEVKDSLDSSDHTDKDDYEIVELSKRNGTVFTDSRAVHGVCPINCRNDPGIERNRRSRSRTHPLNEEGEQQNGLSENIDSPKNRAKRIAPPPPSEHLGRGSWSVDTMPRSPPPPPPSEKVKRWSREVKGGKPNKHRRSLTVPSSDKQHDQKLILSAATKAYLHVSKGSDEGVSAKGSDKGKNEKKRASKDFLFSSKMDSPKSDKAKRKIKDESGVKINGKRKISPVSKDKSPVPPQSSAIDVSPSQEKSTPKPIISPPRLSLINQLNLNGSPQIPHENRIKEKKSKLPWKRKKRKDEGGSPEREYDTEIVTRWLETIEPLTEEEQRNSWERMEVINAYKGEHTAVIGYQDENKSGSPSRITTIVEGDEDAAFQAGFNSSKRKAPKPPAPAKPERKPADKTVLEKPSSESQLKTLSNDQVDSFDGNDVMEDGTNLAANPLYENIGNFRHTGKAPPKPHRRRSRGERSLTTAFENMPSRTKRMAPQPPSTESCIDGQRTAYSNPDVSALIADASFSSSEAEVCVSSTVPLKSALKNLDSKSDSEFERSDETPPKRPVRIVSPSDEVESDAEGYSNGIPLSKYINLAVVHRDSTENFGAFKKPSSEDRECLDFKNFQDDFLEDAASVLKQTRLLQSELLAELAGLKKSKGVHNFGGTSWEDYVIHCKTLVVGSELSFFKAALKCMPDKDLGLMIFHSEHKLDQFLTIANNLKSLVYNPHVLSFHHAFKADISTEVLGTSNFEVDQSGTSKPSTNQSNSVACVVVVTSQVPLESAADFTENQKDYHQECPEKYEADVLSLVMQICFGLSHVQQKECNSVQKDKNFSLESLKLDLVLRCVGNVWVLNPISIDCLKDATCRRDSIESYLADKRCEFDLGILIYKFLHQPDPFTTHSSLIGQNYSPEELPPLPNLSRSSSKLQRIVREVLKRNPKERLTANGALWVLFCMFHGPPQNLIPVDAGQEEKYKRLQNWLTLQVTEKVCHIARKGLSDVPLSVSKRVEYACWSIVNERDILNAMQVLKK